MSLATVFFGLPFMSHFFNNDLELAPIMPVAVRIDPNKFHQKMGFVHPICSLRSSTCRKGE
jgi:hypothetical protein